MPARARSSSTRPRSTTLGSRANLTEIRMDPGTGRSFGVVGSLAVAVADAPSAEPASRLPEDLVRPWLLPAVYERLRTGRGEFLSELRPAFPLFLRFGGIDYDDDDDAIVKLDDLVVGAQRVMSTIWRQRAPADTRRQGRVPLRRVRVADRPRGRCGARGRGGARIARPGSARRLPRASRSASPTDDCAAARTGTRCAGRSSAWVMRSTCPPA